MTDPFAPPSPGRRRLLQAAAALGGAWLGGSAQAALNTTASAPPMARAARLSDIDHFIILMKENRSFDHYFGMLGGVSGFNDRSSAFFQPDPIQPSNYVLPFHLDTHRTSAQQLHDLNHSWNVLHASWNNGRMDRFIQAHRPSNGRQAPLTMGYHTRADLPFYYALADQFTICDRYHASMLGPTHPNRILFMTGSVGADGKHGTPATDNTGRHYSWETYPERLQARGITWRVYHEKDDFNCNVLKFFTQYQGPDASSELRENALRNRSFDSLLDDLRRGNIPQVSWIVPSRYYSEHPDYLPAEGEHYTAQILAALWSNPQLWRRTAVILNYDENDGLFDHVSPPTPEPPDTPGEFIAGQPVGLGMRVPCLMISPFSRGAYVCSDVFDHTSTLKLLEARFGVEVPYLSRWRREITGDLTSTMNWDRPPDDSVPPMPDTAAHLNQALSSIATMPPPKVPLFQAIPTQEAGQRIRLGKA